MENLREVFDSGLSKKNVSVRKMLLDLGINEPTYYRSIKLNKISLSNYRRICDYLEIDTNDSNSDTNKIDSIGSNNLSEYWKGLIDQLSKEIGELKMENWNLKKELGKFNAVPFNPAYVFRR